LLAVPAYRLACDRRKAQIAGMAEHKTLPTRERELKLCQGARLRRLRVALGVSQTDAAAVAGLTKFKWNHMEAGRHPIDPLALQIFCDAHGTGADYVITAKRATLRDDLQAKIALQEAKDMKSEREAQSPLSAQSATENETDRAGSSKRKRPVSQAVAAA
jgi:transcriptional regulator with XRE-family HTH domain